MSAVTGGCFLMAVHCRVMPSSSSTSKPKLKPISRTTTTNLNGNRGFKKKREEVQTEEIREKQNPYVLELEKKEMEFTSSMKSFHDYFEQCKNFIKQDSGPPRWFSPLECGSRLDNSPLLLFLPGDHSQLILVFLSL